MIFKIILTLSLIITNCYATSNFDYLKQVSVDYEDGRSFNFVDIRPVKKTVSDSPQIKGLVDYLRVDPLLFVNMRREKKIINLTKQNVKKISDSGTFHIDETNNGYLVSRQIDGIAGPFPIFKYAWSGLELLLSLDSLPYFGVAPIRGYGRTEVRFVKNLKDAQDLKRLFMPHQKVDVEKMKVGESISYRTYGGRLFGAGFGFIGVGLRTAVVIRGTWETSVQKIAENKLLVTQLNINVDEEGNIIYEGNGKEVIYGVHLGNFVSLRHTDVKQITKSHSYLVDISDNDARNAYIQFVKGNSLPIESLASDKKNDKVVAYQSFVEEMEAYLKRVRFSIPTIFKYIKTKSDIYVSGEEEKVEEKAFYEYSAYVNHLYKRTAVNKQKNKTLAFIGTINEKKSKDNKPDLIGNFVYDYTDNKAKTKVVYRRINELIELSGLKDVDYKFPIDGDIGYFNFNLTINIPTETTEYLMEMAKNQEAKNDILKISEMVVDESVHFMREKEDDCQDFDRHDDKTLREIGLQQLDIHEGCLKRLKQRARDNMKSILLSLKKMKVAISQDQKKEFTAEYVNFGKLMLENKYNFQIMFNIMKRHGATATINFQGERISQIKKFIDWH